MKRNRLICLVLIYAMLSPFFIRNFFGQNQISQSEEPKKGLQFRLREGASRDAKTETRENPKIEKLTEAEAEAIFRRLPPLEEETSEKTDFSRRQESLPPPKTGKIIPVKFPANEQPNAPNLAENSASLEVVRAAPNSFTPLVSDLSVTFSQPMIAVTSQQNASETVPVKLSPEVKGKWRWLGTKTLIFDADNRFPMATKFTATIPAGTKSMSGAVLVKDFSWNFETPPPKVEFFLPNNQTVRRDAVLLAKFNQDINAEAILPKITATANGQKIALRRAEKSEIERDEKLLETVKSYPANRLAVFRAADLLPVDSTINITFEAGIPSAEGDLTSILPEKFAFKTFGSLKIAGTSCVYDREARECRSYENLRIEFTNPIDAETFDKSLVKIEPKIENAEIAFYGDEIEIGGCCKETRRSYKVTISKNLKDIFGQTLGSDEKVEFKIGADEPNLNYEKRGDFITLDPEGRSVFSVYSVNYSRLKVKIYEVAPEDYGAFYGFKQNASRIGGITEFPAIGKLVFDKTIKIKAKNDSYEETKIDLKPALKEGLGHAILLVEPTFVTEDNDDQRIFVWLEATRIGVDAFADYEQLTVYASDLKTGKPLKNVLLETSNGASAVTNDDGLGIVELPAKYEDKGDWLVARNGADAAILRENNYYNSDKSWSRKSLTDSLRWFVFDDRKMYRPGETVSVKGYIRRNISGKLTDIEQLGDAARNLNYVLKDPLGNEVAKGKADLNSFGAFDFQLKLPENLNLGYQRLEFSTDSSLENRNFTHQFQVQEFRRPEFEVSAKSESPAPFYIGGAATVSVEAKYYSGGFLSNALTNWRVTAAPTNYTPPNRDDFTFGKFVPWWKSYYGSDYGEQTTKVFQGRTGADGKHFLAMDFDSADKARPYLINAEARVQDVNRQTFAAATTLLVHPADIYVGIRTAKTFVEKGDNFRVETITTDVDGRAVAGAPVSITAELKDWQQIKGEWQEVTVDTQACQIISADDVAACEFQAKGGGVFTIKASVLDKKERRSESELIVWASGAGLEPSREVEKEMVELIPGKKEYAPGDVAEILVNAPFFPAEGVLTLRRGGIVRTERFTMTEASTILKIPVEERFVPNFHAQVDLFGATKRIVFGDKTDEKLPKRPAFASGALNLEVSTASRKLKVTAEPVAKTLEPGGETSVNVAVTDFEGKPAANTEVALIAVDESVLALTNYKIADPVDVFYQNIEAGAADYYSRENIMLAQPEDLLIERGFGIGNGRGGGSGSGSGDGEGGGISFGVYNKNAPNSVFRRMEIIAALQRSSSDSKNLIRMRRNFDALAIFSPSVQTDSEGKATVSVKLPDNLTRYRITAVAATDSKKFGKTESAITARQYLMVRPSAPRFMNFGDKAELPVVLQNQTGNSLTVDVAIRGTNTKLTDGSGRRVTIAANDRAEIRFPVAVEAVGTARFQIGAVSGNLADAAEFVFPVFTPVTTEAFATYGTTDESGAIIETVSAPGDVYPQFGGLEITTSSTQLQELTDAFIYLQSYPFECSEQISSRILSVAALRDVLEVFETKDLPTKEEIEARMSADIERLGKLQHKDGGFSFWRANDESIPFVSVHVAHALARARAKGYAVPPAVLQNALSYLRVIEEKIPAEYSPETRLAISAYALYVRDLAGEKDAEKARRLLNETNLENLSPETAGWLLSVLAGDQDSAFQTEEIKRFLLNRVTETAGAANFVTKYKDGEYVLLASDRRADGVILEAILKAERGMRNADFKTEQPEKNPQSAIRNPQLNDLIPKLVRGLLANRTKGRWRNTQENAFVLLALDEYFRKYENVTPDFVTRIWLGQTFAGGQKFSARTVNSNLTSVPMSFLKQTNGAQNLILDKQGAGRLYYRIGLKYAPTNLNLGAADYGFTVTRSYEAIDNPADVRQNADGSWTIRSGARIRVRLQMVAPSRRYHVALVDNLPAGLEIVNSNLAVTEKLPEDERLRAERYYYYRANWFDHQNLRDDRAEVFKSLLYEGVWQYSYIARATTPGKFVAPPARAEEMYAPETFGRSQTDFVFVE